MPQLYQLSDWQRDALVDRVDELLDNTEDWQLEEDEFQNAIQSWVNILKNLHADDRVEHWIKEYKDICELS